jgi:ectoine hydroxylase-related dioxygenase (phytanoyl-CoA dioxygenase family)
MATTTVQVPGRPANDLSPSEQKAFYEEQGYLVFPELLDAAELTTLRSALADVLREAEGLTETNDKFSIVRTE